VGSNPTPRPNFTVTSRGSSEQNAAQDFAWHCQHSNTPPVTAVDQITFLREWNNGLISPVRWYLFAFSYSAAPYNFSTLELLLLSISRALAASD